MKFTTTLGCLCLHLALAAALFAEEPRVLGFAPVKPEADAKPLETIPAGPQRAVGKLDWHTDYVAAYQQARAERKQLLLFFRDNRAPHVADSYERDVLAHPELVEPLRRMVRVILPLDAEKPIRVPEAPGGKLLDHSSFEYMYKTQGIAVIDLTDPKSKLHGQVVSAHPFTAGRYYTLQSTKIVLGLPRGTVTQRALIYAVLIHPAAPVSTTQGKCHEFVCHVARRGSQLMAQYESVGHHEWDIRSGEISTTLGRQGSEVASPGGSGHLIDAAIFCVDLWYGSPTHWNIMSTPCTFYGYDMVRAPSGNWYGTGVFAN